MGIRHFQTWWTFFPTLRQNNARALLWTCGLLILPSVAYLSIVGGPWHGKLSSVLFVWRWVKNGQDFTMDHNGSQKDVKWLYSTPPRPVLGSGRSNCSGRQTGSRRGKFGLQVIAVIASKLSSVGSLGADSNLHLQSKAPCHAKHMATMFFHVFSFSTSHGLSVEWSISEVFNRSCMFSIGDTRWWKSCTVHLMTCVFVGSLWIIGPLSLVH